MKMALTESNRISSAKLVRYETRAYRADDRATSQSSANAALPESGRVVKVLDVLFGDDDGGNGTNVEAEEHASNRGDDGEEVGVVP